MSILGKFFERQREENFEPAINWKKIKEGASLPEGDWKRVSSLLTVQGIAYHKEAAVKFSELAFAAQRHSRPFGLLVERERTNKFDENALAIVGWCAGKQFQIGYVDRVEAARSAERYPHSMVAAEFYSLYQGERNYIDVRFFLCVPEGTSAIPSRRIERLLTNIQDELSVLTFVGMADGKRGRFEQDILAKYASLRAMDLKIAMVDEDLPDIKKWLKSQNPNPDELSMAIDAIADDGKLSADELWELVDIVASIDGKVSKKEKAALDLVANCIERSFLHK